MRTVTGSETGDFSPSRLALAVSACVPSERGEVGVSVHRPLASATVVPSSTPSAKTDTVEPAVAVPLRVGVASLVRVLVAGAVMATVTEGMSTTKRLVIEGGLVLPAASRETAETWCAPSARSAPPVQDHAPLPSARAVHACRSSTDTITVAPGSAVPL